jgi:hypothetical protein
MQFGEKTIGSWNKSTQGIGFSEGPERMICKYPSLLHMNFEVIEHVIIYTYCSNMLVYSFIIMKKHEKPEEEKEEILLFDPYNFRGQ